MAGPAVEEGFAVSQKIGIAIGAGQDQCRIRPLFLPARQSQFSQDRRPLDAEEEFLPRRNGPVFFTVGQKEGRQKGLGNVGQAHFPRHGEYREGRFLTAFFQGFRNIRRQEVLSRIDDQAGRIGCQQGIDEVFQPMRVAGAGQAVVKMKA